MDLLTQPPLGTDAERVADNQHPDHQLRVDRWPPGLAVKGTQMFADGGQINEPVDRAQQMIRRDMILEAEAVERSRRTATPASLSAPLRLPSNDTAHRRNLNGRLRPSSARLPLRHEHWIKPSRQPQTRVFQHNRPKAGVDLLKPWFQKRKDLRQSGATSGGHFTTKGFVKALLPGFARDQIYFSDF